MKIFAQLILALVTQGTAAHPLVLQNHNFVDLNVPTKEIVLNVGYPGMGGRACGIELRSSNQFGPVATQTALAEALEVSNGFHDFETLSPAHAETLRYAFSKSELHKYMTLVRIRTQDSSTLLDTIRRTVKPGVHDDPPPRVIVQLVDCNAVE